MTPALPPRALDAIVHLRSAKPQLRLVLIGAAAISVYVPLHRHTADIDLLLVSDTQSLEALLKPLGWLPHHRLRHRFRYGSDVVADILPVNDEVLRAGVLELEPGMRMNLQGCDLALRHAQAVALQGV